MPDRAKCYRYTQQLLVLERCTETGVPAGLELKHVETSLRAVKQEVLLASHPDREIVEYLLRGIRQGFRIGFDREKCRLQSRTQNMSSANERPEIVGKYTAHEQAHGRLVEVSARKAEQWKVHPSPFGVIPKKSNPHKWSLIVDISSPEDHSVNDGISKELASLHYVTVD